MESRVLAGWDGQGEDGPDGESQQALARARSLSVGRGLPRKASKTAELIKVMQESTLLPGLRQYAAMHLIYEPQ
jgi:hypothetical protein